MVNTEEELDEIDKCNCFNANKYDKREDCVACRGRDKRAKFRGIENDGSPLIRRNYEL